MTLRWTATIRYLVTDSRIEEKSFQFCEMCELSEELDVVMERCSISWHSLVGEISIKYNLQENDTPISQAQLFFEGDIQHAGMMH